MRHMYVVAVIGVVLAQAGCSRVLFRDDFDADVVGMAPNETPPGAPAGDSIFWSDPGDHSLRVVAGSEPADHDVQYRKQPGATVDRFVGFVPRAIEPSDRSFVVTWEGVLDLEDGDGPLDVWIGDTQQGAIAAIRFAGGRAQLRLVDGGYVDLGAMADGQLHRVSWTVDRGSKRHSLTIKGAGMSMITVSGEPVLSDESLATEQPTLHMWFSEGGAGVSTYTVDEVVIREPEA